MASKEICGRTPRRVLDSASQITAVPYCFCSFRIGAAGGTRFAPPMACSSRGGREMTSEPASVAAEYFSRMRAGDKSVVDLFHDDAVLVGLGTTRTGKDEIREFYEGVIERAGPSPRSAGPLLADGTRVAAEVYIDLSDEVSVHAVDIFLVEEGRIRSLSYFLCAHSE